MNKTKLLNRAKLLSIFTILYNLIEGVISIFYGVTDETLALFGFGVDSIVEVRDRVSVTGCEEARHMKVSSRPD